MKVNYYGKVCLLVTGILGCFMSAHAQVQETDSLYQAVSVQYDFDNTHNLKLREVLIPTGVIGVSALCVHNGWLTKQRGKRPGCSLCQRQA